MKYVLSLSIFFLLISCKSKSISSPDFFESDSAVNLYAFIGKKIEMKEFDPNTELKKYDSITGDTIIYKSISLDLAFNAKYKVVKNVFNKLPNDTVNFKVFDHYGRPDFENSKYVLLYISKYNDSLSYYHQKYQFDPVKKSGVTWKSTTGESIEKIFNKKRKGVLKARGLFKD